MKEDGQICELKYRLSVVPIGESDVSILCSSVLIVNNIARSPFSPSRSVLFIRKRKMVACLI